MDKLFSILLAQITNVNWANYFKRQMSFIKNNSIVVVDKSSCYGNGIMYINHIEALMGIGVIVHEYGHYIFNKMVDESEKDIITNLFKRETAHFIEDKRFLVRLHKEYCPSLNWIRICHDRAFCPVMLTDGVSILGGKSSLGIYHDSNYPIDHLASELFAECLEAEVLGYKYPITIYKGECPETYSYIRRKIYEVLNP